MKNHIRKNHKKYLRGSLLGGLGFFVFVLFGGGDVVFAQASPACGDSIITSTTLGADLDCSSYTGTALTINADNVILDLGGYAVKVNSGQIGVQVNAFSGDQITNGTITGANLAINTYVTVGLKINSLTINARRGIKLTVTTNTDIENNIMIGIGFASYDNIGIHSNSSDNPGLTIKGNDISNFLYGFMSDGIITYLDLENNNAHNNYHGFYIGRELTSPTISGNIADNNPYEGFFFVTFTGVSHVLNNTSSNNGQGMYFYTTRNFTITPSMFTTITGNYAAIQTNSTSGLTITGFVLTGKNGYQNYGIYSVGDETNLNISSTTISSFQMGVYLENNTETNLVMNRNNIHNNTYGYSLSTLISPTITNNISESNSYGYFFGSITGTTMISNNSSFNNGAEGIRFSYTQNLSLTPSMFTISNNTVNIFLNYTSGMIVSGFTLTGTNVYQSYGIYTNGPQTNLTITNNTISNFPVGVYFRDTISNLLLFHNNIFGNSTNQINMYSSQALNFFDAITSQGNYRGHSNCSSGFIGGVDTNTGNDAYPYTTLNGWLTGGIACNTPECMLQIYLPRTDRDLCIAPTPNLGAQYTPGEILDIAFNIKNLKANQLDTQQFKFMGHVFRSDTISNGGGTRTENYKIKSFINGTVK